MNANLGATYERISDADGAGAGIGITDQRRVNRRRAKEDGIQIVAELADDDTSAYKENVQRDDYERLLDLIRAGEIRFVLVRHADRLHRRTEQAEAFLKLGRERGIVVITATGQRYVLSSAEGRKAFRSAAVDGEYESDLKSERVSDSRERRALAGEYGGGARRPFGWGVPTGVMRRIRDKKTGENRDVEILDMTQHNEAEAAEIRRWKREILAGVAMAQIIRSATVPTVTGAAWGSRSVAQILLNPRTAGHSVYKGEVVKRNAWPAILTDDEQEALRTILKDPARKTNPGTAPKWLGSLIYRCGTCAADGTLDEHGNAPTMTVRYRHSKPVYRCKLRGHCSRGAEEVDAYIGDVMEAMLSRDDLADLVTERPADVDVAAVREQIAILEQRKQESALDRAHGIIDRAMLATIVAAVDGQIAELADQLKTASAENPLSEFIGADRARVREALTEAGRGRRREILRRLMTVTLLKVRTGRRLNSAPFDPESVRIEAPQLAE